MIGVLFVSNLVATVISKRDLLTWLGGWDGIYPRNARHGAAPSSTGGKEPGRAFALLRKAAGSDLSAPDAGICVPVRWRAGADTIGIEARLASAFERHCRHGSLRVGAPGAALIHALTARRLARHLITMGGGSSATHFPTPPTVLKAVSMTWHEVGVLAPRRVGLFTEVRETRSVTRLRCRS